MKSPEFVTPVANINGNNIDTLIRQYDEAWEAYEKACVAFLDIDFHGRDYQTLPRCKWYEADTQRSEAAGHFNWLRQYLTAHREALYDQKHARTSR